MQIIPAKKVPQHVVDRAAQTFNALPVRRSKKLGHLTKAIGHHWRLLSKDNGETWLLLFHRDYDRAINRRH